MREKLDYIQANGQEDAVLSAPRLALANDNGLVDLLSEIRLALLDSREHHVAGGSGGQSVETSTEASHRDDLRAVRIVPKGCAAHVEVLRALGTSATGECDEMNVRCCLRSS